MKEDGLKIRSCVGRDEGGSVPQSPASKKSLPLSKHSTPMGIFYEKEASQRMGSALVISQMAYPHYRESMCDITDGIAALWEGYV